MKLHKSKLVLVLTTFIPILLLLQLRGMYIARQLSFHGVTFDIREVTITEKFREMFDASVELVSKLNVDALHWLVLSSSHSGWRPTDYSTKHLSHWNGTGQS